MCSFIMVLVFSKQLNLRYGEGESSEIFRFYYQGEKEVHKVGCAWDHFILSVTLPRMKKSIVYLQHISEIMQVILHYTKKKCLACGSQVNDIWAISGLLCGSVGQMGQQVCYTFNPVPYFESYQVYLCTCQNITMSDSLQSFSPTNFCAVQ